MSRRPNRWEAARDPWAARRREEQSPKPRVRRHVPTWSLPVTTVAKVVGALLVVLVVLDLAGVL